MAESVDIDRLLSREVVQAAARAALRWDPYEQTEVPAATAAEVEAILRKAVALASQR